MAFLAVVAHGTVSRGPQRNHGGHATAAYPLFIGRNRSSGIYVISSARPPTPRSVPYHYIYFRVAGTRLTCPNSPDADHLEPKSKIARVPASATTTTTWSSAERRAALRLSRDIPAEPRQHPPAGAQVYGRVMPSRKASLGPTETEPRGLSARTNTRRGGRGQFPLHTIVHERCTETRGEGRGGRALDRRPCVHHERGVSAAV